MAFLQTKGKKKEAPKIVPTSSKLLEEYEITIFKIKETLDSSEKKMAKLEELLYALEDSYNRMEKDLSTLYNPNRLDIKRVFRDINHDKAMKDKWENEWKNIRWVTGLYGGPIGMSVLFTSLGLYLGWPGNMTQGAAVIGAILGMPIGAAIGDCCKKFAVTRYLKKYEKKLVENSKKLIEYSKPFIKNLGDKP